MTKRLSDSKLFSFAVAAAIAATALLTGVTPANAYEQREAIVSNGHGYISPSYLVVHETANPGASASNHVAYWRRNQPSVEMTHYVMELDGSVVYHTQPDNTKAWHIGRGNSFAVGIELTHATNKDDAIEQFDEAARWCADYLNARHWGIDRLLSHNDCRSRWGGTDHTDPLGYFRQYGFDWQTFRSRVLTYMQHGTGVKPQSKPNPSPAPQAGTSAPHGSSGFKGGRYRCATGALNIRTLPTVSAPSVGAYRYGQTVNLDPWYSIGDGYVWARYTAYSGAIRYIAVGRATGRPEPNDYLVLANSTTPAQPSVPTKHHGRYTFKYAVKIRSGASASSRQVGIYRPGQSVNIDSTVNSGGYIWGRYTSYSGHTRYVAIGTTSGQSYVR